MQPEERGSAGAQRPGGVPASTPEDAAEAAFVRAEGEDDDGYDPYSDRPPAPEPLFAPDPWA